MSRSLAEVQINLETLMRVIDDEEQLSDETIDEFLALKKEREEKIDGWIGYRDHAKHFVAELKERRDRFQKAYRAAKNVEKRLNERIKYHLENDQTGVPFKGADLGTLYLAKSPKSVAHLAPCEDKQVYGVITDPFYLNVCEPYLKEVTFKVLDKKKVREDLEAGVELSWATIEQGKHVRVKG